LSAFATNRQNTIVRPIEPRRDLRRLLRLVDMAWRVHLRVSPLELNTKINAVPSFLAEDKVGLRGFMIMEPLQSKIGLIIAAGLRDTWTVKPYLDLLLPQIEQAALDNKLRALVFISKAPWLIDELQTQGFETREWLMGFERPGIEPPAKPARTSSAGLRTAHIDDLSDLLALDQLAFGQLWHKSPSSISVALAGALSFMVAMLNDQLIAYEWCDIYERHAHLTRLAVHPDYQGRGIGAQLLYRAIIDALEAGADQITLNTMESNQRSRALYERFGFIDTKQRLPVLWKDLG